MPSLVRRGKLWRGAVRAAKPARMDEPKLRRGLLSRLFGKKPATRAAPGPAVFPSLFDASPAPAPAPPAAGAIATARAPVASALPPQSRDVAWFTLTASDGGAVSAAGEPAWLDTRAAIVPSVPVLAILPSAMPHVCVLLAQDARPFQVRSEAAPAIAAAAILLQTDTSGVVRLKYPLGGAAFLVRDDDPGSLPTLRFDGSGLTIEAAFTLTPLPPSLIPAALAPLADELGLAAAQGLRAAPLLDALEAAELRAVLAGPLIRVMPRDELAEFARLLLDRPKARAKLAAALPQDPWWPHLDALAAWRGARPPAGTDGRTASPASDGPVLAPASGRAITPIGLALTSLARRQILPRRGACVLATARDEGAYLLDWLAYHLAIGFEHVFLYSNDNRDGSDELLALLARHGIITWITNGRHDALAPQEKAYAHALTMLPQILDYRWAAILDVDEFLAYDAGMFTGVADFIGFQEAQSVDAIALCWVMFASLPGEAWSDTSSIERFTLRERNANPHVKSLIRPRLFCHSQPHFPTVSAGAPFEYRTQDGSLHHHPGVQGRIPAFAEQPSAEQAWINHYFLRTAEEALWKWQRGRADWTDDSKLDWFADFVAENFLHLARPEHLVEDRRIAACAAGQGAALARLRALPGVAGCEARIKAGFAERLARTRDTFLAVPPRADDKPALRHFRDILVDDPR